MTALDSLVCRCVEVVKVDSVDSDIEALVLAVGVAKNLGKVVVSGRPPALEGLKSGVVPPTKCVAGSGPSEIPGVCYSGELVGGCVEGRKSPAKISDLSEPSV